MRSPPRQRRPDSSRPAPATSHRRPSTSAPRWCCCVARHTLRVCALYPDLLNIYADRGNLLLLERRCEWPGIRFERAGVGLGDPLDPDAHDLLYIRGGQDRHQALWALAMAETKP